ncbi:MAG: TIR domain-containing protein [Cyclobacteriaceae bacterium]
MKDKRTTERFSTNNLRINIFIGSSSENAENVARIVKSYFPEDYYNVNVWDEVAFRQNKSTLDNLMKFSAIYDYAIMVFVNDDQVTHRGEQVQALPPNIVFENGFFLGRLGANRSFIVAENTVSEYINKSFSDLQGISLGKTFRLLPSGEADLASLKASVEVIKQEIQTDYTANVDISFLPSAALAIGYYNNFLCRICENLNRLRYTTASQLKLYLDRKEDQPFLSIPFFQMLFRVNIVIPEFLQDIGYRSLVDYIAREELCSITLNSENDLLRKTTVYWKQQTLEEIRKDGLILFDFPTTLKASEEIIWQLLEEGQAKGKELLQMKEAIEEKEIFNFIKTLEYKIESSEKRYLRECITIKSLS